MSHIVIDARIINSTTGRYVERLLHYLQEIDETNKYTVLVHEKDKDYWKPANKNFSVVVAEYDQFSFAEQIGFLWFLMKLRADLVHFTVPHRPIFYLGKNVTTFHDLTLLRIYNSDKNWLIYHLKQLVGHFAYKQVARTSTAIITPSKFTKNDLIEFTKTTSSKISVTYEGTDFNPAESKPYKTGFKRFIMYLGNQSDYKNIKRLGDAHQELLKKWPDLGMVLVGSKNKAALANENYFKKSDYKNILFTGFVEDDKVAWLYQNTEAYIFPSLLEGFGLPALEAMGCGAPVVSSSASCLPEIYGKAAHYFDPLNVSEITRAIDEVISNPKLRAELIKNGYSRVKDYSWLKMAKETHAIYRRVLANKK